MKRLTVLVVADVEPFIFTVESFLKEHGFRVVVRRSGEDALMAMRQDPSIAVVVCDLSIRRADGIDLLKQAERITYSTDEGELTPPKFIFVTTPNHVADNREHQVIKRAKLLSDGNVLEKPIDKAELLERVRKITGQTNAVPSADDKKIVSRPAATDQPSTAPEPAHDENSLAAEVQRVDREQKQVGWHVQELKQRVEKLESMIDAPAAR